MSIKTEINFDMNETVTLPLDNGDSLTLRTHIDGAVYEALVDLVADGIYTGVDYFPSRKAGLMWVAFAQGFVVDEADREVLVPTSEEQTDPYVVDQIFRQLRIQEHLEAAEDTAVISEFMDKLSADVDEKILYLLDRADAIAAGGGNNVAVQTMEELGSFLRQTRETMNKFGDTMQEYVKQLSGVTNEQ